MSTALSRSVEDYLKAVYQLTEREPDAATSDIAQRLGVAPASVTGMIKRLADVDEGRHVTLRLVGDDDSERLRYLKGIGLVPMVEMEVLDKQPFGGPITLRIGTTDTRDRVIGSELAACLFVEQR